MRGLKAIVIGGSGGVGRDLVNLLLYSKYFNKVTVVARRRPDSWKTLSDELEKKFNFVKVDDLEFLTKSKDEISSVLSGQTEYDSVFCCLGSRSNKSKEEFYRVEFDYVTGSAGMCEIFNIPYFGVITSMGSNPKSWFQTLRVKGQAEEAIIKKDIKQASIFRVGMIYNTDNDPWFATFMKKWIPGPKIQPQDFAQAMLNDSVLFHQKGEEGENKYKFIEHKEIEKLAKVKI